MQYLSFDTGYEARMFVCDLKLKLKTKIIYLIQSAWFGRESSVSEEFALRANICNLGLGFLATDYMSFVQSPGTRGHNMRPNRFSNIVYYEYCAICKRNYWFF